MAVGKNKRLSTGKKGGKKKVQDPFSRKENYNVKVPSMFMNRVAGRTLINKNAGTRIASEELKGRVFEVNLADLQDRDDSMGYRKIRFVCEDVQGHDVLTNFHGMDMTRDKLCSLISKWKTLIEASIDVRTTDGYVVRIFTICFTKKVESKDKKNGQAKSKVSSYATSGQVRAIRKKIFEVLSTEAAKCDLKELVKKFISVPETLPAEIEKKCSSTIFPIDHCHIRKVKVLKKPKFDLTKLNEMHGASGADDAGVVLDKIDAKNKVKALAGAGGRL